MDVYDNTVPRVNSAGLDFLLTVTPGPQWNGETWPEHTVVCSPTQSFPTLGWVNSGGAAYCRPNDVVPGQYIVRLVITKAVFYTISLAVSSRPAFALTASRRSFLSGPNEPSGTTSFISGVPSISTAGSVSTFMLTVLDGFSNARGNNNDQWWISSLQLLSTILSPKGIPITLLPTLAARVQYNYTYSFTPLIAGEYTLSGKIQSVLMKPLSGQTLRTLVVPGAMSSLNSLPYGAGLAGGIGGANATFFLLARDLNLNVLLADTLPPLMHSMDPHSSQ